MELTPDEARKSLDEIEQMAKSTRKSAGALYAAPVLMIWGVVWAVCFGIGQFYPQLYSMAWGIGDCAGIIATFAVFFLVRRKIVPGVERTRKNYQLLWFSIALTLFATFWAILFAPLRSEAQGGAYICSIVMFAYVAAGIFMSSRFMIALGVAVTVLTGVGYWGLPEWFNLWMAIIGGGALFGSGLYLRMYWR